MFYLQSVASTDNKFLYNFVQMEGNLSQCCQYKAHISVSVYVYVFVVLRTTDVVFIGFKMYVKVDSKNVFALDARTLNFQRNIFEAPFREL